MLEIILVRHGETDWNREMRIMGRKPIPLNAEGRKQARAMGKFLKSVPIDRVFASPIRRARETADLVVRGRPLEVVDEESLAEIHYGDWVGKLFSEVRGTEAFETYWKVPSEAQAPGGEPMSSVRERAISFVERLRSEHPEGRALLVSHADVIKVILIHYLGVELNELHKLRVDNGSLSYLFFPKGRVRVLAINASPDATRLFEATERFKKELLGR